MYHKGVTHLHICGLIHVDPQHQLRPLAARVALRTLHRHQQQPTEILIMGQCRRRLQPVDVAGSRTGRSVLVLVLVLVLVEGAATVCCT
jgi:hypothetical protein